MCGDFELRGITPGPCLSSWELSGPSAWQTHQPVQPLPAVQQGLQLGQLGQMGQMGQMGQLGPQLESLQPQDAMAAMWSPAPQPMQPCGLSPLLGGTCQQYPAEAGLQHTVAASTWLQS